MAHFAHINDDNIVTQVIVVSNDELLVDGVESEAKGIAFCESLFGGRWAQTSYHGTIRKNYAGVGFVYDADRDAFVPPRPFASWSLDEQSCQWLPPVPHPDDGMVYVWDESTLAWSEVT
jgi:hypothetical protein